jgi:hypothetical protein
MVDHLATRGISLLPRDYTAYHQALRARGLIERLDDPSTVATPKPLTDLQMAIERVRQMMSQSVTQTS